MVRAFSQIVLAAVAAVTMTSAVALADMPSSSQTTIQSEKANLTWPRRGRYPRRGGWCRWHPYDWRCR